MWNPVVQRLAITGILIEFEAFILWILLVETDWNDPVLEESLSLWPQPLRGWMPWPLVAFFVILGIAAICRIFPAE